MELLTVAVAERVDAIVEMNQPGVWVLGSTRDEDRNGMTSSTAFFENGRKCQ